MLFKKYTIELIALLFGSAIMAFGTSLFLLPNQLSSGGFAGIATITYYLFNFPMGTTILILNIPLLFLTIYKLGKEFLVKTIIGSISYSIFIDMFDKLVPLTQDKFLACIYGGIFMGLGTAIILKVKGTTGGTELVTHIVREYNSRLKVSNLIVIIDTVIVALNIIFLREIEIGLYSAITIFLMGKVIDIVFEGTNFTKLLFIVSDKNEEIAMQIGENIKRGTTGLYGKGMYTSKDKLVLLCAASRGDVIRVKEVAQQVDPGSFIIIANAREVFGMGFKSE